MRIYLLALALLPAPLLAACPAGDALVFSCTTDTKKEVRVCQGKDAINYRYGKPGQPPEIIVPERNGQFRWEHGEGVSSGVADDFYFRNGAVEYSISHLAATEDPSDRSAHIAVLQPGKESRFIECEPASIRFNPKVIRATQRELTEGTPNF